MPQQEKTWIIFVIIAYCVFATQSIAYFATPQTTERSYILNYLALYTIAVQWIVFIYVGGFFGNERTEKYQLKSYDLSASLTFLSTLALSIYSIEGKISIRQIILSFFIAVWSIRFGLFLLIRIHASVTVDPRFILMKKSTPRFLMAWTSQGMWIFITMIPVLTLNRSIDSVPIGVFDYIGVPIWAVGFFFEVVADFQKSAFRNIAENREKFIHSGLWSISRHPNYFGEILLWTGIALSAFGGLGNKPRDAFVFLSPMLVAMLLIFVSGIPPVEQKADKKYGDDDEYKKYKAKTPALVPFIGRRGDAYFRKVLIS